MNETGRWIVGGLLSATAVAIISFPSVKDETFPAVYHDTRDLHMARAQWVARSELWRREDGARAAREALARVPRTNHVFEIDRPKDIPEPFLDGVVSNAEQVFNKLTVFDSTMRVVATVVSDPQGTAREDSVHRGYWAISADVFLPQSVDANACVVVVRASQYWRPKFWVPFGPCYWYKAYGHPGKGIASWLESTRYTPLWASRSSGYFDDPDHLTDITPAFIRCVEGSDERCVGLMLDPTRPREELVSELRTPHWLGFNRVGFTEGETLADWLLVRMESELHRDTFTKIWKSDASMSDAFQQATGRPLSTWIRSQISPYLPVIERGPLPRRASWLVFGIFVPVLIAAGVYGGSKRGTA